MQLRGFQPISCDGGIHGDSLMGGGFLRKHELDENLTSIFGNGTNILEEIINLCLVPKSGIVVDFINFLFK